MATALELPFLGGGVNLRQGGVRGFGAVRAPPPRSSLGSKGADVVASSRSTSEASGGRLGGGFDSRAPRESKPKMPTNEKPRRVDAVDLWRRAQSAREAAEGVACFAVLSSNGAAFAQLQTNAQAAELWRRAQDLEDAALAAWEGCGEDGWQTETDDAATTRRR